MDTAITKIFHIADVHIPKNTKRHQEYKKVFHNFYAQLDHLCANQKCILIICGDLLHNKDTISNEQVMLTRQFLEQCGRRMPVYIIAGNHDLNMVNATKLDSITPIVTGLANITYFAQSGFYIVDNLAIIVNSLSCNTYDTDDDAIYMCEKIPFITFSDVRSSITGKTSVCLYHGILNGSRDERNFCFESNVTMSLVQGYDYVLLGDIHKHQYLKENIAYSGSMIQQNFGESLDQHGFICWDLSARKSSFHVVENVYCMYTIQLSTPLETMMDELEKKTHLELKIMVYQSDLKKFGDRHMVQSYIDSICNAFRANGKTILERTIVEIQDPVQQIINLESSVDSINDLDFQNSQIRSYCKENEKSEEMMESIIDMNDKIYKLLRPVDERFNYFRNFRLRSLLFKNVYSYEEGPHKNGFHMIDFEKYSRKITGILGMNHVGKSSILDIILFALFDKCSRGKKSDIMCKGKKNFEIVLEFFICDRHFWLQKKGCATKLKGGAESVRVSPPTLKELSAQPDAMHQQSDDSPNHSGNDRNETTAILRSMLCEYDDLVFTSFLFQNNYEGSIELSVSDRVKFFQRILKIDQYERQCEAVKSMLSETNREMETARHQISSLQKQIDENETGDYDITSEKDMIDTLENEKRKLEIDNAQCIPDLHPARFVCMQKCMSEFNLFMQRNEKIFVEKNFTNEDDFSISSTLSTYDDLLAQRDRNLKHCHEKKRNLERSKKTVNSSLDKANEIMQRHGHATISTCIDSLRKIVVDIETEMSLLSSYIQDHEREKKDYGELDALLQDCSKKLKKWGSLQEKYDPSCKFCRLNFDIEQKDMIECSRRELLAKVESFTFSFSEQEHSIFLQRYTEMDKKKFDLNQDISYMDVYLNQKEMIEWNERIEYVIANVDKEIDIIEKEFNKDIDDYKKRISQYQVYQNCIEMRQKFETSVKYLKNEESIKSLSTDISCRKLRYSSFEKMHAKLESLHREKNKLEQEYKICRERQVVQENYIDIFGKSGIPVYLYNKSVPYIEDTFNSLSKRLCLGFSFSFKMDESKNMYIYLNGVPIEICSGFEKLITSIFMRISIQKLHYFKSNFIFIDEGFSNMDAANLEKVPRLFEILQENFDNIYVITHDQDIKSFFEACIVVERNKLVFL